MQKAFVWLMMGFSLNIFAADKMDYATGSMLLDRAQCDRALKILESLAKKGNCDAQYKMGYVYLKGVCKNPDIKLAKNFIQKAADQGQPKAQLMLGNFYEKNPDRANLPDCSKCDYKTDLVEALKWYTLSEQNSVFDVEKDFLKKVIPEIRAKLNATQLQSVEQKVKSFKYKPKKCVPDNTRF